MNFDLDSAIAVRKRDDGLYEKDTFDLASAVPVEDTISAPKKPFGYQPPLSMSERSQALIETMYKEKGEKVPFLQKADWVLTSKEVTVLEKNILGYAALYLSGAGPLYSLLFPFYNAVKGVASASSPDADLGKMIFDSALKGIYENQEVQVLGGAAQEAYPDAPWLLTGAMGALTEMMLFAPGMFQIGAKALSKTQQYRIAYNNFKKSPKYGDLVVAISKKGKFPPGADKIALTDKWLSEKLWAGRNKINYFKILAQNLKDVTGVNLLSEKGAISIGKAKVGQTVNYVDPQGLTKTGTIKVLEGSRAIIDIMGREIVTTLSHLSVPVKVEPKVPKGEGEITFIPRVISKELQPLAEKAKKYKTPEEFVEAEIAKGVTLESLKKPLDILKAKGYTIKEGESNYYEIPESERKDLSQQKRISEFVSSSPIKVKYKRQGYFKFPQEKISSPADVAYAFKELKNEAVERFYVVGIKNNTPISIEPISIGSINAALVTPFEALNLLLSKKADSYYLIHNHPSRDVEISSDDIDTTLRFRTAYEKHKLRLAGHVVINDVEFGFQYPDGSYKKLPMPKELVTPKKVAQYSKYIEWLKGIDIQITNPDEIVKFSKNFNYDKENNALIFYLDTRNKILLSDIISNKKITVADIAKVATKNRAISILLVNSKLNNQALQNLQKDLRLYPIEILDEIVIKEGDSFISKKDEGIIKEKAEEYQPSKEELKRQLTDFYNQVTQPKGEIMIPPKEPPPTIIGKKPELPEPEPIGMNAVTLLNEMLKKAKPLRGKLQKQYTKERAQRFAKIENFIDTQIDNVGGEEGFAKILSMMKGEMGTEIKAKAKVAFEPIKDKLSYEQTKDLYNMIWKHPYLDLGEKISAATALTNLFEGAIPQPAQLVLLEELYGTDLIKNLLMKRAFGIKATDFMIDLFNVPRALLATADMSAFLRQGIIMLPSHPVIYSKAALKTFQFAFSSKVFDQYFKDIQKDPFYKLMRKSKLQITDPKTALAYRREEAFMSQLLQEVPILGQVIKFSERSYAGFLNKLRVDVFKIWADELLAQGLSPVGDIEVFQSAAEVINTFTGRGDLGRANKIAPFLNNIFFSPRLITARFNALNPVWYGKMPKEIRKKSIGDFAKFVTAGITTLALIKLSMGDNVDVETDPRSSDFGKIRIGNTRWDIWGGFQQWVRVIAQFSTGKRKITSTGEIVSLTKDEYPFTTRKETVLRFVEGKLAPVPALANALISGAKTFEGEDITLKSVIKEKLIPMYIQDITEAYEEGGLGRAIPAGATAFLGVGVQTYKPKVRSRKGKKIRY